MKNKIMIQFEMSADIGRRQIEDVNEYVRGCVHVSQVFMVHADADNIDHERCHGYAIIAEDGSAERANQHILHHHNVHDTKIVGQPSQSQSYVYKMK